MTETANTAQLPKPNGLEGVVAKRRAARYEAGRRSPAISAVVRTTTLFGCKVRARRKPEIDELLEPIAATIPETTRKPPSGVMPPFTATSPRR